jgi:hypothetical protein
MFRFSLLTLLGAILVISVGCAAVVSASDVWVKVIVTVTVLALLIASVGSIYLPTRSRAFAGGFAIFGWAYLLLAQGPWLESLKPQLATTVALNKLQRVMHEDADVGIDINWTGPMGAQQYWNLRLAAQSPDILASFHQIGQSLWSILLACVGGVLARAFGNWRSQPEADGAKA